MALTFYSLLEACLLMVNAVAVLHEERFLAKVFYATELNEIVWDALVFFSLSSLLVSLNLFLGKTGKSRSCVVRTRRRRAVGWGTDQLTGFGEERGTKHQVINLIHSVRTVMRIPLILLNSLTILLLLLMG